MDKDDPIDENGPNPDDETLIGRHPDLDAGAGKDSDADVEAVPVDDVSILDFGALDEDGPGEEFDIDKTINFTPVEEDGPGVEFDIDKTVNFSPIEEAIPVEKDESMKITSIEDENPIEAVEAVKSVENLPAGDESPIKVEEIDKTVVLHPVEGADSAGVVHDSSLEDEKAVGMDKTEESVPTRNESAPGEYDIDKTVPFNPVEGEDPDKAIKVSSVDNVVVDDEYDIDKTVPFNPVKGTDPNEAGKISSVDDEVVEEEQDIDNTVPFNPVEEVEVEVEVDATVNLPSTDPAELGTETDKTLDLTASQIEDAGTGAAPRAGVRPSRRRLSSGGSTRVKRRSTAEQYQKTSKPGKSFLVKKILFYMLPLSFIAMIAGGFVLRNENDQMLWVGLMQKLGVMDGLGKEEAPESAGSRNRPEVADYQSLQKRFALIRQKLDALEEQFRLKDPWTKDKAKNSRGELNTTLELLKSSDALALRLKDWFEEYDKDFSELQAANEAGDKNRVDELNKKLERDKYLDVDFKTLGKPHMIAAGNKLTGYKRRAKSLHNRLPSLEEIVDGKLPETGKKRSEKREEKRTAVSFNPRTVTPFYFMSTGEWRRDEVVTEDLAFFGEPARELRDTVLQLKELEKQFVVVERIRFANQIESDPIEQKLDVVKDTKEEETIKIGGLNVACRVLRSETENRWVPTSGPMANQLPVKVEKEDAQVTAVEIGAEELVVGEVSLKCTRVKYEGTVNNSRITQTVWYSTRVPLWIVKKTTEVKNSKIVTETLIAYGKSSRPDFPVEKKETDTPPEMETPTEEKPDTPAEEKPDTPVEEKPDTPVEEKPDTPVEEKPDTPVEEKPDTPVEEKPDTPVEEKPPPQKTYEDHIREATVVLKEAVDLFRQVARVRGKGYPDDLKKLKILQKKANQAEKLFREAIEGYQKAKEISPDPERQENFIVRMRKLLKNVTKYLKEIQSKIEE